MAVRIAKETALGLILFVKSVKITGVAWDPTSRSAWEMYRQMGCMKLKKANPLLEVTYEENDDFEGKPVMHVEYSNGEVVEYLTKGKIAQNLRLEIFARCEQLEDESEESMPDVDPDDELPEEDANGNFIRERVASARGDLASKAATPSKGGKKK